MPFLTTSDTRTTSTRSRPERWRSKFWFCCLASIGNAASTSCMPASGATVWGLTTHSSGRLRSRLTPALTVRFCPILALAAAVARGHDRPAEIDPKRTSPDTPLYPSLVRHPYLHDDRRQSYPAGKSPMNRQRNTITRRKTARVARLRRKRPPSGPCSLVPPAGQHSQG